MQARCEDQFYDGAERHLCPKNSSTVVEKTARLTYQIACYQRPEDCSLKTSGCPENFFARLRRAAARSAHTRPQAAEFSCQADYFQH